MALMFASAAGAKVSSLLLAYELCVEALMN